MAGPVVWNSIPAAIREADTVSSFKRKLKTHFFLCALAMFDFDFCNALPVRARVGSGTITAIYYYYYYYIKSWILPGRRYIFSLYVLWRLLWATLPWLQLIVTRRSQPESNYIRY